MDETSKRVRELLREAKQLAREYRALTGRPLGITGEVAESEAAELLDLELAPPREKGHDATSRKDGRKLQIKGRCVLDGKRASQQRLGRIEIEGDFEAVLLVLMDERFEPLSIHEAPRDSVIRELLRPGSKARNERHTMSVSKFIRIGRERWPGET